jgi:hypothetical protein
MILIPGRSFYCVCLCLLAISRPGAAQDRLHLSLSTGYQSEDFRWSIAGNTQGANPNILSELKWTNLAGPVVEAAADWNCWKSFTLRSTFSRLFIVSGDVTDMDYQGNDRTSRSYFGAFDANKGMSFSWRTTLEYAFHFGKTFTLTPALGYALHRQSLYLLSSDQSGSAAGLRSTYATRYQGVVLGVRGNIRLPGRFSLEAALLYDILNFRGRANWNLISTFRHPLSFEDDANGYNLEGNIKLGYTLNKKWSLFLTTTILHSKTGTGTDWLYLQSGQDVPTQFNGAVRDYISAGAGIKRALF